MKLVEEKIKQYILMVPRKEMKLLDKGTKVI
jgi:hypothetical protein